MKQITLTLSLGAGMLAGYAGFGASELLARE